MANKVFNVAAIVRKWKDAMASPVTQQNYKDGINRVSTSPLAAAAEQTDKAVANYRNVVSSQAHKDKLLAYPLAQWKAQAIAMAGRLADGAVKASPKYQAFVQSFTGTWTAMKEASEAIGGSGIAAAKAKQNAALEILMQAGKKYGGQG